MGLFARLKMNRNVIVSPNSFITLLKRVVASSFGCDFDDIKGVCLDSAEGPPLESRDVYLLNAGDVVHVEFNRDARVGFDSSNELTLTDMTQLLASEADAGEAFRAKSVRAQQYATELTQAAVVVRRILSAQPGAADVLGASLRALEDKMQVDELKLMASRAAESEYRLQKACAQREESAGENELLKGQLVECQQALALLEAKVSPELLTASLWACTV